MNPGHTSGPPQSCLGQRSAVFLNILPILISLSLSEKLGGKYHPNKQTKIESKLGWMPIGLKAEGSLHIVFLIEENKIILAP